VADRLKKGIIMEKNEENNTENITENNKEKMMKNKKVLHELLNQLHDYFDKNNKTVPFNNLISNKTIKEQLFASINHVIEFNKKYARDLISLIELENNLFIKQNNAYKMYLKYYTEIEKIYTKYLKVNKSIYDIDITLLILQFDIYYYKTYH
jgi:hypothetical protein